MTTTAFASPIEIGKFPFHITRSGTYILTKDRHWNKNEPAISVTSRNPVIINFQTFTLTLGGSATGIHVSSSTKLTLTSVFIRGDIELPVTADTAATAADIDTTGIVLINSKFVKVVNCSFINTLNAITGTQLTSLTVKESFFFDNLGACIVLTSSQGVRVFDNDLTLTASANPLGTSLGMYFSDVDNLTVQNNTSLNLSTKAISGASIDLNSNKTTIDLESMKGPIMQVGDDNWENGSTSPVAYGAGASSNTITSKVSNPDRVHFLVASGANIVVSRTISTVIGGGPDGGSDDEPIQGHIVLNPGNCPDCGVPTLSYPVVTNSYISGPSQSGIRGYSSQGQIMGPILNFNAISGTTVGIDLDSAVDSGQANSNFLSGNLTAMQGWYTAPGESKRSQPTTGGILFDGNFVDGNCDGTMGIVLNTGLDSNVYLKNSTIRHVRNFGDTMLIAPGNISKDNDYVFSLFPTGSVGK